MSKVAVFFIFVSSLKFNFSSNLSIEVYNLQGRIINKIVKDRIDPGYYTFNWDGTNEPSGIYIIKVQISETIKIFRTVLIK